jgi:hypothetical protein
MSKTLEGRGKKKKTPNMVPLETSYRHQYGTSALYAGWLRLHVHTQNTQCSPKVLGLFFKIKDTGGRNITFFFIYNKFH